MTFMQQLISDEMMHESYDWLCKSRIGHPPNTDIWDFRWNWEENRERLQQDLLAGSYRFAPVRQFRSKD